MRHDYGEQRFVAFGWIRNRLHVCVYTLRKGSYRIISLRKANRREISGYCTKVLQGGEAVDQKTDWERVDAMTDEDIARQIAADPDVAPDMSEALERGEFIRLHVFNVFALRTRLGPPTRPSRRVSASIRMR